ncbi:FAD:protein FMN transferase [Maridesulfovibrio ferrireducens]|uniref:FAD:protein FMN transferase n=1 Tax=Maridesulfovibrio ferrireducens TaxID=246191 RepID=UPI0026F2F415|nr:FAD:protein FMN transferase [Maridesulfovibrio ferrireducens]
MAKNRFSRRSFMKTLAATGIGAAFVSTPVAAAMRIASAMRIGDKRYKVSETRFLMGTYVAITALHESKDAAEQATAKAFAEIDRLAALFDRHQSSTPVSVLNETGRLTDVAPELFYVMKKAQTFNSCSKGAFDATVLPVVEMLSKHANPKGQINLTRNDLDDALDLVDSDALKISNREIYFDKQGMAVTLDGIGKGFIVDCASEILSANGVINHLINAGGDIRAGGERSKGQPWIVAIEDPAKKGNYPAVIQLKDAAVATSGGYEVYFDADRFHHHVVDPRTSVSPTQILSVSVIAPTVMQADALSTSAFVMTPQNSINFVNEQKNSECLIVNALEKKLSSKNWNCMVRV